MTDTPESVNLSDVSSRKVDTELLNELRDLFARAEDQKERYDFTWNGKAKAYFEAATPTTKTLRPQPEESYIYADDDYKEKVNTFNDSENLFITGDNLEALKLLQESYLGKIDMIYIDPPYNTGKDFVYHDNFKSTQKDTDVAEGSVDEDGNRLVKNEKNSGRYHSDWLSMMYPRLKLARNLLSDRGVIFVSIDDNEQANLKLLMDEVFGEDNFVAKISWRRTDNQPNLGNFARVSEYIFVYAKNYPIVNLGRLPLSESALKEYRYEDSYGGKFRRGILLDKTRGRHSYPVITKGGNVLNGPWMVTEAKMKEMDERGEIYWTNGGDEQPYKKIYLKDSKGAIPNDFWGIDYGTNQRASLEVGSLFGKRVFDFPKPVSLLQSLISIGAPAKNAIVVDFFAGSGSVAHSVMQLNKEDDGNRKFIVATLDEPTPEDSEARKAGYQTIDQISRERIRRAARKLGDTNGFRALKVDKTGLKADVFKTAGELTQENLQLDVDNQVDAGSDYDLLYDVLVDGALEYNRQIATETISNEPIIKYDYLGELSGVIAYFGDNLTNELTREIAKLKPLIAVFKESTFNKSSDKVNVLEQFRVISPETKVKVI